MEYKKVNIGDECILNNKFNILSRKWTILLLLELSKKNKAYSFGKLKENLTPITSKILSLRLSTLEKEGYISKKNFKKKEIIYSTYSITKKGDKIIQLIQDFKNIIEPEKSCDLKKDCDKCKHL